MKYLLSLIVLASLFSCRRYVDVGQPPTQLSSAAVFSNDATATGAMLAVYSAMESQGLAYNLILYTGLSSDELKNHSGNQDNVDMAANNLAPENNLVSNVWTNLYKYIYQCNLILENLDRSTTLTPAVSQHLRGEAKFTRAFCYYYLTQLFGKVPLLLQSDYRLNSVAPRNALSEVREGIIRDLEEAKQLLDFDYRNATGGITTERIRPSRAAALSVLGRMYLQDKEWVKAEESVTEVISRSLIYQLETLPNVFLKSSREAIFQWMSVVPRINAYPGAFLIFNSTPGNMSIYPTLLSSFSSVDNRPVNWVKTVVVNGNKYFGPFKYKVGQNATTITEYTMVIRLAELILISAEAKLNQGKVSNAESDLNLIRVRAGLAPLSGTTALALSDSIQQERKRELFCEFGDRWITLKRTGTADAVLGTFKGNSWQSTDQLYPVPRTELMRNPNLDQNAGY